MLGSLQFFQNPPDLAQHRLHPLSGRFTAQRDNEVCACLLPLLVQSFQFAAVSGTIFVLHQFDEKRIVEFSHVVRRSDEPAKFRCKCGELRCDNKRSFVDVVRVRPFFEFDFAFARSG